MRVLVLGGTKFIGPFVVRSLHERGCEVAVFHRGQSNVALPETVRHIHGDRANLEEFEPAFTAFAPDVVLDMRPLGETDSQRVMTLFTGKTRRAVMVSSIDVYRNYDVLRGKEPGPPDNAPLTEDSPLRPQLYPYLDPDAPDANPFGAIYDKILAERAYLGDPALPGTVLRLPFVYGPEDYQHRLHGYLKRMDDARPAILLSEDMRTWRSARCYVENVGLAIALAVLDDRAAGRIYNVGEPDNDTEVQWVERIAQAAGWKGEIVTLPDAQLPPDLRFESNANADLTVTTDRIRTELGYAETVGAEEAMLRTIDWERPNPPAQIPPGAFDYEAEDKLLAAR